MMLLIDKAIKVLMIARTKHIMNNSDRLRSIRSSRQGLVAPPFFPQLEENQPRPHHHSQQRSVHRKRPPGLSHLFKIVGIVERE